MSMGKAVASMGALTMVSRVLGFIRDMLMANMVGAGMVSDAFFVAFKLPNFMRRLFAEGAFNAAFVPLYTGKLVDEGREAARLFAENILSVMTWFMLLFTIVCIIAMPWFTYIAAPGFSDDPPKFALTVELSRITFPYLMCMSLTVLFTGMVNSENKFAAGAAAPILLNLCLISGLIGLPQLFGLEIGHAMAWSVFLAGIAQAVWMFYFTCRIGMRIFPKWPRYNAEVMRLLKVAGPAILGASVAQINLLVGTMIASAIPGAVTYLYYADRVTELPMAIIGIAIGTALLPMLSKYFRLGEIEQAHGTMNRALEMAMLFTLPATFALLPLAYPIVAVLFQHGEFGADDTAQTAMALVAYALGLPAFVTVKLYAPGFYANHDTKTPLRIAIWSMLINVSCGYTFMLIFGTAGLAMASTIAVWFDMLMMQRNLKKQGLMAFDARVKQRVRAQFISALVMLLLLSGPVAYFWSGFVSEWSHTLKTLVLFAIIAVGGAGYFLSAHFLKAVDFNEARRILKRTK